MDVTAFLIALVVLISVLLMIWLKSGNGFQVFFSFVLGIYLIGVINVVVFPLPIGLGIPDFKPTINLIPFRFGSCELEVLCIRQIYQNVLLTVPLGFGVNFLARIKPRNILWLALEVGFAFEFVQFVISIIVRSPFRAVDINDLILNASGVLFGYGIFRVFAVTYLYIIRKLQLQPRHIFAHIHDIVHSQN